MRISDWSSDVCSSDLLDCWQDSNGPYHDERMLPSCAIHQGDWPALQKPNEIVLPVQRGETQCADRHHACTNLVCRPLLRTKEHTSELQSIMRNSYAFFCLKKKIYTS